jgi:hypothetical protein
MGWQGRPKNIPEGIITQQGILREIQISCMMRTQDDSFFIGM